MSARPRRAGVHHHVDPTTGLVTFTEYRAVTQLSAPTRTAGKACPDRRDCEPDCDDHRQGRRLPDGEPRSRRRLSITDDGPMIAATGTAPSLTLSETHLTATALNDNIAGSAPNVALTTISGNFSTAFTSAQGADGATISYALSITGGNGTASGLIDSHTGLADVLVLNGDTIEGHVGTTAARWRSPSVDPDDGVVTFTEYRAVSQPFAPTRTPAEGVSLTCRDCEPGRDDHGQGRRLPDVEPRSRQPADDHRRRPDHDVRRERLVADPERDPSDGAALDRQHRGSAPDAALMTTSVNFSTAFTSAQGADGADDQLRADDYWRQRQRVGSDRLAHRLGRRAGFERRHHRRPCRHHRRLAGVHHHLDPTTGS